MVYIPPEWLHNRVIACHRATGEEFVVRRLCLADSKRTSTLQVVPLSLCGEYSPSQWDLGAKTLTIEDFLDQWSPTGRTMGYGNAPL